MQPSPAPVLKLNIAEFLLQQPNIMDSENPFIFSSSFMKGHCIIILNWQAKDCDKELQIKRTPDNVFSHNVGKK